jgi:hypothetical protein
VRVRSRRWSSRVLKNSPPGDRLESEDVIS